MSFLLISQVFLICDPLIELQQEGHCYSMKLVDLAVICHKSAEKKLVDKRLNYLNLKEHATTENYDVKRPHVLMHSVLILFGLLQTCTRPSCTIFLHSN